MNGAKEKAKELINKFQPYCQEYIEGTDMMFEDNKDDTKECALICVDEILNLNEIADKFDAASSGEWTGIPNIEFWQQVREEIIKL